METIAFQKVLMLPLREAMRRYEISFMVKELHPVSSQKKEFRVAGILQPAFASGKIFMQRGMADLERELAWFPALAHYDLLDALAYSVQMATYPQKEEILKHDPFSVDAILAELEARSMKPADDVFIWNKSPKLSAETESHAAMLAKLQKPPFNMNEEKARKLLGGGGYAQ